MLYSPKLTNRSENASAEHHRTGGEKRRYWLLRRSVR